VQSPLYQERLKLGIANLVDTFTGSIRTQAHKKFGEKGAWAYPETAEIFSVPPIISGTGKATNFKFCTHILSIDRSEQKPIINFGKSSRQHSGNFSGHPHIGRIARSSLR